LPDNFQIQVQITETLQKDTHRTKRKFIRHAIRFIAALSEVA
jgi:hypothetical protein